MADQLDSAMVAQISEQIRRSMGGALVQVGNDLQKLDRISKDVVSPSGGIGKLDSAFMGISTRILGPAGMVYGLYQVSNALSKVAADSVQMQAFSRNTGIAADNVKNMQLQLQMMGKSSEEAKATIGQLAGLLNDFNTNKQGSSLSQNLLGREGGAEVVRNLNAAKNVTEQIAVILKTYQNQPTERQRRGVAEAFGMDPATIERMIKDQNLVVHAYKANEQALEEYHRASVIFSHNIDEAWKAVSGNVVKSLNDMTGGIEGSSKTFETIVAGINAQVDALFNGLQPFGEGYWAQKFNFGGLKQDFEDVRRFVEWWNSIEFKKNASEATGIGRYPQAEDPMTADQKKSWIQFPTKPWKNPRGTSGATDFSGMRRTEGDSMEEEQTSLLTDVRDILKRMEDKNGGSGGGGSGGSGGGSGGGYGGYGSANSAGGAGLTASRGASGKNTAEFMKHAKDQLRKEGVPEANLDHAAALLAGQAQAESGINPNLSHDGGTGYGIYGARDDPRNTGPDSQRRTGMLNWMKENGYEPNSLEGQSRYMAHEAMTGKRFGPSRNALMGASADTMATGTQTLTRNFEAPARDNSSVRLGHAQAALNGGIVPQPGSGGGSTFGGLSFGGNVQENQGNSIRRGRLDPRLRSALDYASSKTGLTVDVNSGGQRMPGAEGWTGSHRHDHGKAADFLLRDKDGKVVSPNDPRALEFYRYSGQAGVTGGGHSYGDMGQRTHLDIDSKGVYAGGPAFRMMVQKGQQQSDEFAAAARERMAAKASGTDNSLKATVDFTNVPPGVKTSVESEGEIFKELQVSKSKQGEVAGGSPGQPFTGVW